ncbi:Transposon TX1 [Gigaspora margarita]|uniref:Transposon TX1 n=1 Tax=Gigaspora margarita TaxID=4874 RepID=A0A8H3XL20_GIGMA|nr:Transposon TX1 [Gigaspora margarita]
MLRAREPRREYLDEQIANLANLIKEENTDLADKMKQTYNNFEKIRVPDNGNLKDLNILQYIQQFYTQIYIPEFTDKRVAEKFMNGLLEVSDTMNNDVLKPITVEKISQVINTFPNNKSPGTDGLTYEFYKLTIEAVTPVLEKVFNKVLIDRKIRRIPLGPHSFFKLIAYANDLSLGVGLLSDWKTITKELEDYEKASNTRINKKKNPN